MMRYAIVFMSIVALVGCQQAEETVEPAAPVETAAAADPTDAVVVAPDHYKVEFENDQVRVLRITYAAGDETAMHSHPDGVAVFFSDQNAEFTLEDGTTEERPTKAGDALWLPAETHAPKALTDVSLVLVEITGGGGEMAMTDTDATVVDPDHYKVEFENDQVRVLRVAYEAGDETAMHSHPDNVVVFLGDGEAEATLSDGSTQQRSGKAGDVLWAGQETHGIKALTDISVVLIELKGNGGE
jgi:quercetin dioxygenase-like cupin family protein